MCSNVRFLIATLLLMTVVIMVACNRTPEGPESWVVPVDPETLIEKSEEEVRSYFQENAAAFMSLADYLLTHEMELKAGRPIYMTADRTTLIPDSAMRSIAERLLSDGPVQHIWSLNDVTEQQVVFVIDGETASFEQTIRFVYAQADDISTVDGVNDAVNRVRIIRDLSPDWYYCLFYYDKIRDADRYRQAVWDLLEDNDGLKRVRQSKEEGQVTLVSREGLRISPLELGTTIPEGDWAMAVHYRMLDDELIGNFVCYVDPASYEILGLQPH